eukprot:5527551-Pyramimonas_sp.AAC.1
MAASTLTLHVPLHRECLQNKSARLGTLHITYTRVCTNARIHAHVLVIFRMPPDCHPLSPSTVGLSHLVSREHVCPVEA